MQETITDRLIKLRQIIPDTNADAVFVDKCLDYADKHGNITAEMMRKCNILYKYYHYMARNILGNTIYGWEIHSDGSMRCNGIILGGKT